MDAAELLQSLADVVEGAIADGAVQLGGTFFAEHGIGRVKVGKMPIYKSVTELNLMRAVKRSLDPAQTMNPACLLSQWHDDPSMQSIGEQFT